MDNGTTEAETQVWTEAASLPDNLTVQPESDGLPPIYGIGDYRFNLIHITALVSLSVSIAVSAAVLGFLLYRRERSLWKRPIGERLVVYLAVCDLLYSISHLLDHSYMMLRRRHPADDACATFAFFINEFILAQALLVGFTAVNAVWMVVLQKKALNLGRWDWKLLAGALGVPTLHGVILGATGYLGPGDNWCLIDLRKGKAAKVIHDAFSITVLVNLIFMATCYGTVWYKLPKAGIALPPAHSGHAQGPTPRPLGHVTNKYHGSARIMLIIVAAYFIQWWPAGLKSVLTTCGKSPGLVVYWFIVCFCNMGGVFNFIAYTVVRRKYQKVNAPAVVAARPFHIDMRLQQV